MAAVWTFLVKHEAFQVFCIIVIDLQVILPVDYSFLYYQKIRWPISMHITAGTMVNIKVFKVFNYQHSALELFFFLFCMVE